MARLFSQPADNFMTGENVIYAEQMYQLWAEDRTSVHASWDAYFTNLTNGVPSDQAFMTAPANGEPLKMNLPAPSDSREIKLTKMINEYRKRGHELAKIWPIDIPLVKVRAQGPFETLEQNPAKYGFTEEELDVPINYTTHAESSFTIEQKAWTPRQAAHRLEQIYLENISFEYLHLSDRSQILWFRERIEKQPMFALSVEEKKELFDRICESQMFTGFLAKKYSKEKRFGIDGCDAAISGLEKLVDHSKELGATNIIMGMAHRGRLNTLACVFDKPYVQLFSEFSDPGIDIMGDALKDAVWGFSGDVKYHLGASNGREYPDGKVLNMAMPPNPSHLEMVDPVVMGKARSKIEQNGGDAGSVVSVIIHGDAAMAGQGIVYETVQMEKLRMFSVGGTIHVAFNNNVGFTTNPYDSRSSRYCTDVAKTTNRPIIHVNADEPEHVDYAFKLAMDFRQEFKRDIFIDVVGYRYYGHNEADTPEFTQPQSYEIIKKKKNMYEKYCERLIAEGVYTAEEIEAVEAKFTSKINEGYETAKSGKYESSLNFERDSTTWSKDIVQSTIEDAKNIDTSVALARIRELNNVINTLPDTHDFHKTVKRVYKARHKAFDTGEKIDWGCAEMMAYATLLDEGYNVRISGEDVERGTFTHRQGALYDQKTQERFNVMAQMLPEGESERFCIGGSLLSEYAVLGFEYGYSISNPNCLTIWEAQFGDFANVGQPIIDNMIVSGEIKWGIKCGLVMMLPHGYDGMGPEHSSARLERFLQLCDDNPYDKNFDPSKVEELEFKTNISVCNITSPANYFHVLRRQMLRKFRKPLAVMTPKKILRHPLNVSTIEDFGPGSRFKPVYGEAFPDEITAPKDVKRVIFCSGQVYFDLLEYRREQNIKDTAILRLEQIAPFPYKSVKQRLEKYANAEVIWAQEEHRNMGAWDFVCDRINIALGKRGRIDYRGRPMSASTAVGSKTTHMSQLAKLVKEAFE